MDSLDVPEDNKEQGEEDVESVVIETFISAIFGLTKDFRSKLRISEDERASILPSGHKFVTDYIAFDVISIVERMLWAAQRLNQLPDDDMMTGTEVPLSLLQSYRDEVELWNRKLSEVITILTLFEGTSTYTEEYVRHYVLCSELDSLRKRSNMYSDYYDIEQENVRQSMKQVRQLINALEELIDLSKAWYVSGRREGISSPRTLSDMASRMAEAAPHFFADEILMLGMSYVDAFGRPSNAIHADLGGELEQTSFDDLRTKLHKLTLGSVNILIWCARMQNVSVNNLTAVPESLARIDTAKLIDTLREHSFKVGDFVVVLGELCEVIETKKARLFGWASYKVKFISRPLLPGITTDWFPVQSVTKRFASRAKMSEQLLALWQEKFPNDSIPDRFSEAFESVLKEEVLRVFKDWKSKQPVPKELLLRPSVINVANLPISQLS